MASTSYYCVIRYVPDVIRDEGINIGIVVETGENGDKKRAYRFAESFQRAAKIDPFVTSTRLDRTIRNVLDQVQDESEVLDLTQMVAKHVGGKVQLTQPRLTLVDNLEDEVNALFEQFILDDTEHRHHGMADTSLRKEVRELLAARGINGDRVRVSSPKEQIRVAGRKTNHSFDISIQVNHQQDFIRCISFDVDHYAMKLESTKALVYDARDIRAAANQTGVLSILYPPKIHNEELPQSLFAEAQTILRDEQIPTYNFDSANEIEQLIDRVKN